MQVTRKSHLTRSTNVRNMEMYNQKGKNTQVKNLINQAKSCNREETNKGLLEAASMSQNRFEEVLPSMFEGMLLRKMINPITLTIEEESTHQIKSTKQVWSTIITSPKYPKTTPGMSLILKLIELISRSLMWFRLLLEVLTTNNMFRILTTMLKIKTILNLQHILWCNLLMQG